MTLLIADTGPLVALLNRNESDHKWCIQVLNGFDGSLQTCEAVLTEAFFLLKRTHAGEDALWDLLNRGLLKLAFDLNKEMASIQTLTKMYQNVPMSLADGCLVRMAELYPDAQIFTLDKDFQVYRKNRNEPISCLAPWG
ncbi:MAG: type II toxin-antitoxin system VapC family toxin [Candidatus Sericytochromatia bacterium]